MPVTPSFTQSSEIEPMKQIRLASAALLLLPWAVCSTTAHAQPAASPDTRGGPRIIFEEPELGGIAGNFHVPPAEHKYPADKPFNVVLWQPNPTTPDGELVPTDWKAGDMTGFYPAAPITGHQAAFRNAVGASAVQIDGGTVGVYLNSRDLPNVSPGSKMMITPAFMPPKAERIYPFAEPGLTLVSSLELQVPTARDLNQPGNFTYVVPICVLEDRKTGTQISYGVDLFHHATQQPRPQTPELLRKNEVGAYDEPSHSFEVGNPLVPGSRVVTILAGSTQWQTQPWRGWRPFKFAITPTNFKAALSALKEKAPAFKGSADPADYALVEWHLNAELKFGSGPAELGWSMRHARVALMPEDKM
jgi:hypothetical protein